ncbi:MAG TPA: response regulator transcription factor [Thermoanaerobaculia bacterium]|nr:response regulator transcription factor [Thermoanaerobaculia bacterium]
MRARRILIVEDDPKTSASIEMYLRHDGYRTDIARTGDEGLARARQQPPDLVILDLMLPGRNGLEVCAALRAESRLPVIMLTARSTEDDKLVGLESGADDYVTKPFSPRELVARVRAVLRRAEPADEAPLVAGDVTLDRTAHEVIVRGESVALTAAEFRLLETLMRSPGRVFTRDELVEGGLDRTVDVHIKNLRRKIEIDRTNPARIVTVFGVGYKFV